MAKGNDQEILEEIYTYIGGNQHVYFATTLENQPKVRTMVLFFDKGRFFFITFTNDSKVAQIRRNKLIEVLLPIKDEHGNSGHIRMTGKAKICHDPNAKEDAQYFCYFFDEYFDGADDPDFCLIELEFQVFEFLKPGEKDSVKINV